MHSTNHAHTFIGGASEAGSSNTITWPTDNTFPLIEPSVSYSYWPTPAKIRLELSEVEYLRTLAKKDRRLRDTLRKLAPHLEVTIDFPGDDEE